MIGLGSIFSGAKIALVVGLVAAAGVFYWHYTDVKSQRDALQQEVGALKTAHKVQQATIKEQQKAIAEWKAAQAKLQETLKQMAEAQLKAAEASRRLNDVLSRHDLHALSLAKPGLIERRINSGTADVLGMFQRATVDGPVGTGGDRPTDRAPPGS